MGEDERAEIRANAEKQHTLALEGVGLLVAEAHALLEYHNELGAWALLSTRVAMRLDCLSQRSQFAVEMLVAHVVQQTQMQRELAKREKADHG